jgi:hypothetical protein
MSQTHILVEKNGIQDNMNINVWNTIGADQNKYGWKRVPQAPIEVVAMKSKSAEAPVVDEPIAVTEIKSTKTESVIDPVGAVEKPVKEKVKPAKKK